MKTKKVLLNVIINAILQICNIVLMLLVRRAFSITLGDEILGLNSVYSSLMSFLTLSELGLGVTVCVCLYKPLAESNEKKIASYMQFLRIVYALVGVFVLIAGTCLIPFLPMMVKGGFNHHFMGISFELYVLSTAITYFFSYKKVILGADQKGYVISASQTIYKVVQGVAQLLVLYCFKNYYFFIVVAVICNFAENYIVSKICDLKYPYISDRSDDLDAEEKRDIRTKVFGMLCYKLSNYVIQGTDNIIISAFLGASIVAYYNNYNLIITYVYVIFASYAVSAVAGLGNLIYADRDRLEFVFSKMLIVQQYLFSFSSSAFLVLSGFFVRKLFPSTEGIGLSVVILMVIIIYIRGYSEAVESIRNAIGEYSDKYYNLCVALLNVVISVLLVKRIGIAGVLVGTLVSYIVKEFILVPRIVFGKVLKGGVKTYYMKTFLNIFLSVLISGILYIMTIFFPINSWVMWVIYGVLAFALSLMINTLVYHKTQEFFELKRYIINIFRRVDMKRKIEKGNEL